MNGENKMHQQAEEKFQEIPYEEIKKVLRRLLPSKFDKMLFLKESIKRGDYLRVNYEYKKARRFLRDLQVPLFDSIAPLFRQYEAKNGEFRRELPYGDYHKLAKSPYVKENSSGKTIPGALDFGFTFEEGKEEEGVSPSQPIYFFPEHTYSKQCSRCSGDRYVTCPDCNGKHQWDCPQCNGTGKVDCFVCRGKGRKVCDDCRGQKKITCYKCKGKDQVKCDNCGGKGYKVEYRDGRENRRPCGQCKRSGYVPCPVCVDGKLTCERCKGTGEIPCAKCNTTGKITCSNCNGTGTIVCSSCYADNQRYGKIDCPICHTAATLGYMTLVKTLIDTQKERYVIPIKTEIELDDAKLFEAQVNLLPPITTYKKLLNENLTNYDPITETLLPRLRSEVNVSLNTFPMLLEEKVQYDVITSIQIAFKYLPTNTEHELIIFNFRNDPQLIFLSELPKEDVKPRQKDALKSISKTITLGIGKLLKTKKHLERTNKKTELLLMIYLAKADGTLEDEEKAVLLEKIHALDLTKKEKNKLLGLLNLIELPPLQDKDLKFSSYERAQEILRNLEDLAYADGTFEITEKQFLEELKQRIETIFNKK